MIRHRIAGDLEDPSVVAARWVERLTSGEASEEEIGQLREWLDADPGNRRAYERARAVWTGLSETSLGHRRRRWELVGGALAASLALVFSLSGGWHDYSTSTGALRHVELPDGSIAWLDSDSAIDIAFDDKRRIVRLSGGRVAIDVVKDLDRPLIVKADGATITDIGTIFSVDLANGLDVAVSEGIVSVERGGDTTRLEAGEAASFDAPSPRRRMGKTGEFAWRDGRIVLDEVPLDAALAELDRYYSGRIMLRGDGLSHRRVSGTLFAHRAGEGVETLARSQGLRVTRLPWLVIVGR